MKFEIQTKQDLSGIAYVVRFPENMLDKKALYTVQETWPDFLLPFRCRFIDGEAVCVYLPGNNSKFQYRFGSKGPQEYAKFWESVLQPFINCGDWFLDPFSFYMDYRYLFSDSAGSTVRYIYIPCLEGCSDYEGLKRFAIDLSEQNPCTDSKLETKALRSIMQDFRPSAFLRNIQEMAGKLGNDQNYQNAFEKRERPKFDPFPGGIDRIKTPVRDLFPEKKSIEHPKADDMPAPGGGIVINLDKPKGERKKEKKEKTKKESKKLGIFGQSKRDKGNGGVILGAPNDPPAPSQNNQRVPAAPVFETSDTSVQNGNTLLDESESGARFMLAGDNSLPHEIPVAIPAGGIFTIGRFDISVGRKQCSFEFDKQTRAVSRHHAALERNMDGSYVIVDTSSRAGTYVNGEKLTPNVPFPLHRGDRVSFGNAGAVYIWQDS